MVGGARPRCPRSGSRDVVDQCHLGRHRRSHGCWGLNRCNREPVPGVVPHRHRVPFTPQVEVIGPSGARPADGRIWYAGDSLPLRITLDEDLGSEDRATVWSWNGAFDDDDQDGRADEGEYHAHVLRFQPASGRLVLDVPLIDIPALPESMDHSLLSFWVEASDRAGNPMTEGGRPGLDTDAATFTLMRRAPTSVDLERLRLDVVNGTLRPGAIHRIGLDILDGNGFASLDSIRFDLDGVNERCTITHHPWNGTTEWDRTCFMEPPVTMLQEVDGIGLRSTWSSV